MKESRSIGEGLNLLQQSYHSPTVKSYITIEVEGEQVFKNEIAAHSIDYNDYHSGYTPNVRLAARLVPNPSWFQKPKPEPEPIHIPGDVLILHGLR